MSVLLQDVALQQLDQIMTFILDVLFIYLFFFFPHWRRLTQPEIQKVVKIKTFPGCFGKAFSASKSLDSFR